MTAREALLTLSLSPGVGPRRVQALLERFGSAKAAVRASEAELLTVPSFSPELARGLQRTRRSGEAGRVLARAERLGLALLTLEDPDYPALLRAIHDPPPVLYVRGALPEALLAGRAAAVVGTRDASGLGQAFAFELGSALAAAGVVVVSGLALGVDGEAHRGALAGGGPTVAVLGTAPDRLTPRRHHGLALEIAAGGAVLSEHPPGAATRPGHFVGRNRIISGLCRVVAVVEAGERSGALTTAEFALEQGRAVMAMPGRPTDPRCAGSLALLRDGAGLLTGAEDVLAELGVAPPARPVLPEGELRDVCELLARLGPVPVEELALHSDLPVPVLLAALARLELGGVVRQGAGAHYHLRGATGASERGADALDSGNRRR